MIDLLDKTLTTLLRRDLPALISGQVAISFAPPDNNFPPTAVSVPAIDLFLYDVRENMDLRNTEWLVERRTDGKSERRMSAVRVDCSYLITAWPSTTAPNPTEDEHRILSAVMISLLRYPKIPQSVIAEGLFRQNLPLPATTLQPGRLQSLGEFWQALGGKPKAALNYTVTIAVEVQSPVEEHLVTEKVLAMDAVTELESVR